MITNLGRVQTPRWEIRRLRSRNFPPIVGITTFPGGPQMVSLFCGADVILHPNDFSFRCGAITKSPPPNCPVPALAARATGPCQLCYWTAWTHGSRTTWIHRSWIIWTCGFWTPWTQRSRIFLDPRILYCLDIRILDHLDLQLMDFWDQRS